MRFLTQLYNGFPKIGTDNQFIQQPNSGEGSTPPIGKLFIVTDASIQIITDSGEKITTG